MTYIRRKSQKQEARTAKEFSGRVQIASGAIEQMKGDVRTGENKAGGFNVEDFLIENKFTDSDNYKLTLATWNKVSKEAFRDNFRTPLMQVDVKETQLVVFDEHMYKTLGFSAKTTLSTGAKSFMLKESIVESIETFGVVEILFMQAKSVSLYVMEKNNFLIKLG